MKRSGTLFSILMVVMFLFQACAVKKKRLGDMNAMEKIYRNTTARFNGYFNAEELITASTKELEEQYTDNYNKILPVYKYTAADNPGAVSSNLDEAVKKVSIVVSLKRESDWTDDCYLVVGKSQFLKQDYESAENTFRYLKEEFSPAKLEEIHTESKSKKRKKRKKSSKKKRKKKSTDKNKDDKKEVKKKKRKKSTSKSRKKQRKEAEKKRRAARKKKEAEAKKRKKAGTEGDEWEDSIKEEAPKEEEPKKEIVEEKVDEPDQKLEKEKTDKKKKDKKEEYKPENKDYDEPFLTKTPAYWEGLLWLAKTYIERGKFIDAQFTLNDLRNDAINTSKEIKREIPVVTAYYFLEQKKYSEAIPQLQAAIEMANEKKLKARYSFIIAQIYQKEKQGSKAIAAFEKVIKLTPDYDMSFRSRLNIVMTRYEDGIKSGVATLKDLERMTRDDKNIDYKDQIYFAMAKIAMRDGDEALAMEHLKSALESGKSNQSQQAESYLLLADLHYTKADYVESKLYYDSTLQVLAKVDDRYEEVEKKSKSLREIASNIQIISLQDSLLAIADMTPKEKSDLAKQIKKQIEDQIAANSSSNSRPGKGIAGRSGQMSSSSRTGISAGGASASSSFFAYNARSVKKGIRDFQKRWGNRQLEDNWRRSNRNTTQGDEIGLAANASQNNAIALTDDEVSKLLEDVPNTPEEKADALLKIENALFTLGKLYRDRIEEFQQSINTHEQLFDRFPGSENELEALYYAYLNAKDLKNSTLANKYKQMLVDKYPKSKFAKMLTDPSFLAAAVDEEKELRNFYDQTYLAFNAGQYDKVQARVVQVSQKFGKENNLNAKFDLLDAMNSGKLEGKEVYVQKLNKILEKYPRSEEARSAREMLRVLGEKVSKDFNFEGDGEVQLSGKYKFDPNKQHYVVVALAPGEYKLTSLKKDLSNYNRKFHKLEKLRVANVYMGADTRKPLLVVRKYGSKDEAMPYYNGAIANKEEFITNDKVNYEVFVISQTNYRALLKSKDVDEYRAFFDQKYLK